MSPLRFLVQRFREVPRKRLFFRSLALGTKGGNTTATSADGTDISIRASGDGPAMVMVHGTLDGMSTWSFVEPSLSEDFTISVYDRRGRGDSGDHESYEIAREVDDLAAVLRAAGGDAHVVAHSFGAVVAMLAAASGVAMRSLVIYEPPMNGHLIPGEVANEITRMVADGDADGAINTMALKLAGVASDQIGLAMSIPPVRKTLREGAQTAPREIAALRTIDWSELPISGIPTLVVRGSLSRVPVYPTDGQLSSIADDIEVDELAGQTHLAQTFDPIRFLTLIRDFASRAA